MLKDLQDIAEQIGWPLAVGLFLLVASERMGLLSVKIGGSSKSADPSERQDQRLDAHESEIHDLGIKVAKLEAVQDERKK